MDAVGQLSLANTSISFSFIYLFIHSVRLKKGVCDLAGCQRTDHRDSKSSDGGKSKHFFNMFIREEMMRSLMGTVAPNPGYTSTSTCRFLVSLPGFLIGRTWLRPQHLWDVSERILTTMGHLADALELHWWSFTSIHTGITRMALKVSVAVPKAK